MYCRHCKKEEETITVAGTTYCANCSTALTEEKVGDLPKHKIPKMEVTDNEIRTEEVPPQKEKETKEIRELSREVKIPKVSKDELGGSAILLDILSDTAKEETDSKTLEADKRLEEASEEVLDVLTHKKEDNQKKHAPRSGSNTVMNDVTIKKRTDYQKRKHQNIMKEAEEEIKDEVEKAARIVTSESGYTKEWDLMIMSIALSALALVLFAIYVTFR